MPRYSIEAKPKNLKRIGKSIDINSEKIKSHLKKLEDDPYHYGYPLHGIFKTYNIWCYKLPNKLRLWFRVHEDRKTLELLYVMPRKKDYKFTLRDLKRIILPVFLTNKF